MADVIQIGKCAGCQKHSRLENDACASCRKIFGPRSGLVMARIRVDPAFASLCYDMLDADVKRLFVQWFGLPQGCTAV